MKIGKLLNERSVLGLEIGQETRIAKMTELYRGQRGFQEGRPARYLAWRVQGGGWGMEAKRVTETKGCWENLVASIRLDVLNGRLS